ncbi:hypothetical protein [Streptomyces sp. NPDC052114]|uniref:hypothetical protein n=1 Tax=unclassified Streptomyces TaxID=2593676 RepID=UPI0034449B9A
MTPHRNPEWTLPESVLARSVFAPLGGIVEIGAVAATGTWTLTDASVAGFVAARRGEVARILELVQEIGDFGAPAMGILDELGYLREHPVEAASLLLWSSGYEEVSPRLEEPDAVRRMSRMAADLQPARFLQALIEAAITRGPDVPQGAELIAEALRMATDLLADASDDNSPAAATRTAFRIWRTTHLAGLLLPTSQAHPEARPLFRAYGHAVDELLAT